MVGKLQVINKFLTLFNVRDNRVIRSEKLPASGSTIIAETKIRTWAEKNQVQVTK